MFNKILPILIIALLPGVVGADYLQAVVANATTGIATFNSTVSSGNTTWTLRHVESGATPASQVQSAFTNAVGLTASYSGTYGNLTGNFTFSVTLNVSLGVANNSTVWATETKSAGFQITGPPAPSPTPTPPPPPPSTGDLRLFVTSPDSITTYRERLPVEARVTATNNTTVYEVRMAIENREPRPAPAGGTACDAVPSGWKVAAETANQTWARTWNVNDSDSPVASGTYTVYVRAENSGGRVACGVVPDVAVKVSPKEAPTPTPSSAPGVNATVEAAACGEPGDLKPCPDGLRGPPTKNKYFQFTLSVQSKAAVCGPTDCERFGVGSKHGFTPKTDGQYCAKAIDPRTDAISGNLKFGSSPGGDACWMVGTGLFGSSRRLAPGLQYPIQKADDIPCKPVPGYLRKETKTDESGAVVTEERTAWTLRPGYTGAGGKMAVTLCTATVPVFWRVYISTTCPTALAVPGIITAGKDVAGTVGNAARGVLYSGSYSQDGGLVQKSASPDFGVPLPCTGKYEVWTLEQGEKPEADSWSVFASFEVTEGPGWGFFEWVAVVVALAVGGPLGTLFILNLVFSKSKTSYKLPDGRWTNPALVGYKYEVFPAQTQRLKGLGVGEVILMFRTRKVKGPEGKGRISRHDFIGGDRSEWSVYPENVKHVATRTVIQGHGKNDKGLHAIRVPMHAAPDTSTTDLKDIAGPGEEFDGIVAHSDPAVLEALANEIHDRLTDEVWKRRVRREKIRDAKLAERIRGADSASRQVDSGAAASSREVGEGLPSEPTVQPRPGPTQRAPPGGLF